MLYLRPNRMAIIKRQRAIIVSKDVEKLEASFIDEWIMTMFCTTEYYSETQGRNYCYMKQHV